MSIETTRQQVRDRLRHLADERAHRLASTYSEEVVRCEGESTDTDCYRIPHCQADEHVLECISHLVWHGQAISTDTDDGYIAVQLGDFTPDSLAQEPTA